MSAPIEFLPALPVSLLVVAVLARRGAETLVATIAALVAMLARDPTRARRALAVLWLLRSASRQSEHNSRRNARRQCDR